MVPSLLCHMSAFSWWHFLSALPLTTSLTMVNVRRLFVTLGVICPGLCFVWLSFMGCNSTLAIVALCIMAALNAGKYGGQMMSAHDMCPNYAGSLAAMTVTLGNAAGFLSPIVTGLLTNERVTMLFCNLNLFLTTISFSANHCSLAEGIPIVRSIHDSGGIGLHILWNSWYPILQWSWLEGEEKWQGNSGGLPRSIRYKACPIV